MCSVEDSDESTSSSSPRRIPSSSPSTSERNGLRLESVTSLSNVEKDLDQHRDLFTHFYVADRAPAPYADSSSDPKPKAEGVVDRNRYGLGGGDDDVICDDDDVIRDDEDSLVLSDDGECGDDQEDLFDIRTFGDENPANSDLKVFSQDVKVGVPTPPKVETKEFSLDACDLAQVRIDCSID